MLAQERHWRIMEQLRREQVVKVCDLIRVEEIVTDSGLPQEFRERYESAGIAVLTP